MADNKRLRFDLELHTDSKNAKKEIQQLGEMLNQLAMKNLKLSLTQNISEDLKQASKEVGEFSALLNKSFNANTGKLDLSKLSTSLKAANTDITQVAKSFAALGNDGTMAFASVVKQINAAEVPLKKTNKLIDEMWTSLKNTMKWQISSTAIHGLQSALSGAYGYAQDLNKSLNDIRIVTGYNADQMAQFAAEANKAAKALSTTTTSYTNASLIYYQQGLTDQEVLDRTEIAIKMANAAGASAQIVSDQLTAVWNNFYDGSKSLEYYADVMTALGAATASSTDEIAEGLEKFAAVAETVGLSYDYAATALATVTATTRQSADVVGTAFKTLFSRLQDLELGNTLDDGTTLGQYSEALNKVGVNIKTASGEMKGMDTILDELGAKWKNLSQDTKVALAQTVAGTRQYTQLVALMDNWDYFQENLSVAKSSSGTLDKQAEIYAESWEAAQKRVKASLEDLYTTLIDDEFFIKLTNTVAKLVDGIKNIVDGLGGVKGLLATISTYVLTIGRTKISEELIRLTGPSQKKQAEISKQQKMSANQALQDITANNGNKKQESSYLSVSTTAYDQIAKINKTILDRTDELSEVQRTIVDNYRDEYEQLSNIAIQKAKSLDLAKEEEKSLERSLKAAAYKENRATKKKNDETIEAIDSITGSGHVLNKKGAAFTKDELKQLKSVMKTADLGELSYEDIDTLTMDNSKLSGAARESHMEKYQSILAKIQEQAEKVRATLQEAAPPDISKELAQYKELSEAASKLSSLSTGDISAKDFEKDPQSSKYADTFNESFTDIIINGEWKTSIETFDEAIARLKTIEQELQATGKSAEEIEALNAEAAELREILEDTSIHATTMAKVKIKKNHLGINEKDIEAATDKIDERIDREKELTLVTEKLTEEGIKYNDVIKKMPKELPSWQEQLVGAAQGVSSLVMGFTSLSGLYNTLTSSDLSFWEKLVSVTATLGTTIPMLTSGIKALQGVQLIQTAQTKLVTAAMIEENAALGTSSVLKKAIEASDKTQSAAELSELAVKKGLVAATEKENVANAIKEILSREITDAEKAEAIQSLFLSNVKKQGIGHTIKLAWARASEAAAAWAAVPANEAESASLLQVAVAAIAAQTALSPLLVIVLGIVAAAALIVGVIAFFNALSDAYNKDANQAKEAAEQVETLTTRYQELKTAAEELKEEISDYNDALDALDELEKGTDEYAEALENANKKAKELIETYGLWGQYSYQDGKIVINEDALTNLQNTADAKTQAAERQLYAGKIFANQAQAKASQTGLVQGAQSDVINHATNGLGFWGSVGLSSFVPGAGVLQFANTIIKTASNASELAKNVAKDGWTDGLGETDNGLANILKGWKKSQEKLAEEMDELSKANLEYAKQINRNIIETEYAEDIAKISSDATKQSQITSALTGLSESISKDIAKEIEGQADEISDISTTGSLKNYLAKYDDAARELIGANYKDLVGSDKQMALTYAQLMGYDRDTLTYESGNGVGSVRDEKGNLIVDKVSDEVMRREIAKIIAEKAIEDQAKSDLQIKNYTAAIGKMVDGAAASLEKYGADFTSPILDALANQDYENLDFTTLFSEIDPEEIAELTGLDSQGILDILGIDKKTLEDLGYDANKFTKIFKDGLAEWTYTLSTANLEASTKTVQEAIKNLSTGSTITAEAYTSLKEFGIDVDSYFAKMADGTYVLTAAAEEFLSVANGSVADSWIDKIKEYENARTYADNTVLSGASGLTKTNLFTENTLGTGAAAWDLAKTRVSYLNQMGAQNGNFDFTDEQLALLNRNPDEGYSASELKELAEMMQAVANKGNELQSQMLLTADSIDTLRLYSEKLEENGITLNEGSYQKAVIKIASGYGHCSDELKEYQIAVKSGDTTLIKHSESLLGAAMAAEDLANAYGLDIEQLSWYAEALAEKGVFERADKKALSEIAKEQLRFDQAVTNSLENQDAWKKSLEDSAKSGRYNYETISELRKQYGNLLDIDGLMLSESFVESTENLELMEKAISGDAEAYEQLQKLASQGILDRSINGKNIDQNAVNEKLLGFGLDKGAEGQDLSGTELEEYLLKIVTEAQMTAEQANAYLSTIGVDASIKLNDDDSLYFSSISKSSSLTSKYNLTDSFDKFEPNKIELTKYDDVVDRYKEIDDKISDITRNMEKLNKQAERYTGKDKINALKQVNNLLEEEMELTKDKIALAEDKMKTDADYLIRAGADAGVSFKVDGNGNIANYKEVMEELYHQLNAAQSSAMADGHASETEQEAIDAIQEKIDAITEAMSAYDESKESLKDLQEEALDQLYQWQDNNFEDLKLKLEFNIEMSEDDLSWLDHQLSLIEDDIYSAADAIGYMGTKVSAYNDISVALNNNMAQLKTQLGSRAISEAAYVEGMKNIQEQSLANAEALRELKAEMEDYYGNTLAEANEELAKQKKGYENVTNVLDHYANIMSILGEEENEEWQAQLLATRKQHAENQLASAKETYQMYADEEAYWRQQMEDARERGDTELYELYKKNWEAASDAMTEAQDDMLTKTEEWAQAIRDEVENELKNLGKDLEKQLTGGVTFDDLTTQMERQNSLQEEYLTTTNQIYETNKLMRTAENEIAKTSSTVAKNKLKNYVNETKQMQEQGKLSKFELEMQQAKYDLLLAEIALDEAQNAKSTVRLQKDANGNYGYVYTADADKVSQAQQAYEDADNAYYNKSLEGANNYTQKYISTMQEMYDEITAIMNDFALSDEGRDEKIRATKAYYYEKLGQYSELYSVAAQADSRALQEAWTSDWQYMVTDTQSLESAIDSYVGSAQKALDTWSAKVEAIKKDTGLNNTTQSLKDLSDQSNTTRDSVSGLVDKLDNLFDKVNNAIVDPDFSKLYTSIKDAITQLEEMAEAAREAWRAAMTAANVPISPDTKYQTTDLASGGKKTTSEVNDSTPGDNQQNGDYVAPDTHYEFRQAPNTTTVSSSTSSEKPDSDYVYGWKAKENIKYYINAEDAAYRRNGLSLEAGSLITPESKYKKVNNGFKTIDTVFSYLLGKNRVWLNSEDSKKIKFFDTGGYTGQWGSSGKLAMLHEKELVLNKNQTQDFLASMEILDKILQLIDLQALNSSLGGALSSPNYYGNNANALEQNVHIEASFPNATNHSEIEEAFKNLTNLASQYANRK